MLTNEEMQRCEILLEAKLRNVMNFAEKSGEIHTKEQMECILDCLCGLSKIKKLKSPL